MPNGNGESVGLARSHRRFERVERPGGIAAAEVRPGLRDVGECVVATLPVEVALDATATCQCGREARPSLLTKPRSLRSPRSFPCRMRRADEIPLAAVSSGEGGVQATGSVMAEKCDTRRGQARVVYTPTTLLIDRLPKCDESIADQSERFRRPTAVCRGPVPARREGPRRSVSTMRATAMRATAPALPRDAPRCAALAGCLPTPLR